MVGRNGEDSFTLSSLSQSSWGNLIRTKLEHISFYSVDVLEIDEKDQKLIGVESIQNFNTKDSICIMGGKKKEYKRITKTEKNQSCTIYSKVDQGREIKTREKGIKWKDAVFVVDGIPKYLDPNQLDVPEMFISSNIVNTSKNEIIKAGKLEWLTDDELLYILDVHKSKPNWGILKTEKKYKYKIENDAMYLSEDD